ncbi:MAG TPA: hypothetical protein VGS57_04130 [Thermoanaerobaculia bacterium]|jgi:predicted transglutaminase-like cysteine proteinase|nr:hypothetical protein [Thermoanaerobaculia bacterium]
MKRIVLSLIVLAALLAAGSARAAEGPAMTTARQLDLASQHLASTAQQQAKAGSLTSQAAETAAGFAALVRDFHFGLEPSITSTIQAEADWAQVAEGFTATRDLLYGSDSRALRNELHRVNALMNQLDRAFGGSGFWSGRNGWNG